MARPLALITGGVRRLGAVISGRLAEAGYDLALTTHIDGDPDEALSKKLQSTGVNWQQMTVDLSDPTVAENLISDVSRHFGCVPDVLVNNAAMFGQDDCTNMDLASLDVHFRLNLFAPLLLAKALVASADEGAQPAIINIVDQRIANPHGDQLSYTLSKQALGASVRTLANAFGDRARVNAVAPGLVIETEDYHEGQSERLATMMPLGSLPDPRSVAEAVCFLAQASDVTGQILFVDGGAHLKSFGRDFLHL